MLTKRPTVALTSERSRWLFAVNPTRACEPRTEITRPKDVTLAEPDSHEWRFKATLCKRSLDKLLNRNRQLYRSAIYKPTVRLIA
jgi:hypothetical protein